MEQDREAVVMLGAGFGPLAMVRPAIWVAATVSGLLFVFSVLFEPPANRAMRAMMDGLQRDALRLIVADGTLRQITPGIHAHAQGAGPDGEITGLMIMDRRARSHQVLILAGKLLVAGDEDETRLNMERGMMLLQDPDYDAAHVVRFGRLLGDPAGFLPSRPPSMGPVQVNTQELVSMLRESGAPGEHAADLGRARAELLRRLTDWLWPLVFVAIAAWAIAGAGSGRSLRRWRLFAAVVVAALGRLGGVVLISVSVSVPVAAYGVIALPIALAVVFVVLASLRNARAAAKRPALSLPWRRG